MKNSLKSLTVLLLIVLAFCFDSQVYAQYFPIDTAVLNNSYADFKADPSYDNQKAFFNAFPSHFDEFMMVYGYWKSKDYDLTMYRKSYDHIWLGLAKLDLIPDTLFCDKLIQLSFLGHWEADGPGDLQRLVRKTTREKSETMFKLLKEFSKGQQVSFWLFYFNSRFEKTNYSDFNKFQKEMMKDFPEVVKSMEIAYPASEGMVWY